MLDTDKDIMGIYKELENPNKSQEDNRFCLISSLLLVIIQSKVKSDKALPDFIPIKNNPIILVNALISYICKPKIEFRQSEREVLLKLAF